MSNKSFEELMSGYVQNRLTEEELALFLHYLQQEEYQSRLNDSIDQLLADRTIAGKADPTKADRIFHKIMAAAGEEKVVQLPGHRRKSFRTALAVAASLILVVGLGILFFHPKPAGPVIAGQKGKRQPDSALALVRHEVNTTGKDKRLQLPDGSWIVLADKSEITYREPFRNSRDITLTGKANFKVAKDKARPFTVISDQVATTALGTEFTVTAFAHEQQITVRLYEGKVVIRPVEKQDWRMKNDFYLSPGQEFVYRNDAPAKVRAFRSGNGARDASAGEKSFREDPSLPKDMEGSWYMFNNEPLEQVFASLSAFYNVKILYKKQDVRNLYFIGKYNNSDSVETILKRIALLNGLTVSKKDSAFIISK
ncbi:FecR family protein [Paraflavisolibacter sp. H34]|uniref:FecR family protein n=1 Tax=Huijunlia imazamoxiresistens TaxID=3127457 RepID=UPI00301A5CD6